MTILSINLEIDELLYIKSIRRVDAFICHWNERLFIIFWFFDWLQSIASGISARFWFIPEDIEKSLKCWIFCLFFHKAECYGKIVQRIRQFEPSTKICNVCRYHNSNITLKEREWICPDCKTKHDREVNAAIDIKKFSLDNQNLIVIWHLWNAGDELWNLFSKANGKKQEVPHFSIRGVMIEENNWNKRNI